MDIFPLALGLDHQLPLLRCIWERYNYEVPFENISDLIQFTHCTIWDPTRYYDSEGKLPTKMISLTTDTDYINITLLRRSSQIRPFCTWGCYQRVRFQILCLILQVLSGGSIVILYGGKACSGYFYEFFICDSYYIS